MFSYFFFKKLHIITKIKNIVNYFIVKLKKKFEKKGHIIKFTIIIVNQNV